MASGLEGVGVEGRAGRLRELAWLFLRLGTTAFGGPAAHLAIMEDEVVRRRRWVTPQKFLDLIAAVNFIPGPNSTEVVIHIGYIRAGVPGLMVAGACFILPAALMVTGIAWAYVRFGALPATQGILYGVQPVVIAVVLQALGRLGKSCVKSRFLAVLGIVAVAANFAGASPLAVLAATGVVAGAGKYFSMRRRGAITSVVLFPLAQTSGPATGAATAGAAAASAAVGGAVLTGFWPLFLVFLKIGSVLFGSGYVLLAFLRADLVDHYHWLDEKQLLDAVAIGQVTPGPVFTTATFIGYLVAQRWGGSGVCGAAVATAGIFVPAFVFVAISSPLLPYLRRSAIAGAALDGLNVASLALMAVVSVELGRAALLLHGTWIPDPVTLAIAGVALLLLVWKRVNSAWLIAGAAVVGGASLLWR